MRKVVSSEAPLRWWKGVPLGRLGWVSSVAVLLFLVCMGPAFFLYQPVAEAEVTTTDTTATTDTTVANSTTTETAATSGSGAATDTTATDTTTSDTVAGSTTTTIALPTLDADVVVFSTQTSGLAAVRELALGAPDLRVVLISNGGFLETPLVQGLCVEDARNIDSVSGGFYREWRDAVIHYYSRRGIKASTGSGRFVYEPEVAASTMWSLVQGSTAGNVQFYSASLVAASDQGDQRYVDIKIEGGGLARVNTRYFIDASVEGDLARMLGADYRIGRDETVYNDLDGNTPAYPSAANGYATGPQWFSALLTLKVYTFGTAPRIANLVHPSYNPASYYGTSFAQKNVDAFSKSWSMKIAVLPNGKRELNETWSDWPDVGLSFQWIFEPARRKEIRQRVLQWSINRVRYLQEHGYSRVSIASIPQKLYVREGPRIVGLDTYTASDIRMGVTRDPVAAGCYCEYDRHDAFWPTHVETTRYVYVPMQALMAAGHPALLVSTAVSTDYAAYCSAVRMEHARANMGAAAGAIMVAASQLGVDPSEVPYETVRARLLDRGYVVGGSGGM